MRESCAHDFMAVSIDIAIDDVESAMSATNSMLTRPQVTTRGSGSEPIRLNAASGTSGSAWVRRVVG
jgi:hypothetical protein